jgi:uncharacterized protein YecT (DUF1311 family)
MNSRRGIMVAATVALAGLIGARGARAADDGPASFDCAKDRSPLAVTICNDQPAAAAERRTAVSYLALYFKLDERSRVGFRVDHLQWIQAMSARCPQSAIPRQFGADQLALSVQCVRQMYSQRADLYRKKLSGAALEEVNLSPALLKKIQQRLVELRFLSGTVDGMFGADTRAAIRSYQASIGHAQGNFVSAQERTMLLEAATTSAPTSSPKEAPVLRRRLRCDRVFRTRRVRTNSSLNRAQLTVRPRKQISRMRPTLRTRPGRRKPTASLVRRVIYKGSISSKARCS